MPKKDIVSERCRDKNELVEQQLKEGDVLNKTPTESGVFHTESPPCSEVKFNKAKGEKVIQKGNSFIVLGKDRPNTLGSGWGATVASSAACIDLVVGRMSSARGGKGPKADAVVDNSMSGDAARIYISELANIDDWFGLVRGSRPNATGRSAIGIKADGVRIIGREGVKIVTGKMDGVTNFGPGGEPNSLGGKIKQPAPTIEFIAGNVAEDEGNGKKGGQKPRILQPLVKGEKAVLALEELVDIVSDLTTACREFRKYQTRINRFTANGLKATTSRYGSATVATSAARIYTNNARLQTKTAGFMWLNQVNTRIYKANYLQPFGDFYICSENVKTT